VGAPALPVIWLLLAVAFGLGVAAGVAWAALLLEK
jgi:hypothetical protein